MRTLPTVKWLKLLAIALWLVASAGFSSEPPATSVAPPQTISVAPDIECPAGSAKAEQCVVTRDVYIGWRSFHTHCFQCHGGSALGSTFAPNLLDRLNQRVDHARFLQVLMAGYTGQVGAMPSFAMNPAVQKDQESIFTYLRARADGRLPPGRPQLKK